MYHFNSSDDFKTKSVFLAVNASLLWLSNVTGVYLVQVSLLLIWEWDTSSGHSYVILYLEVMKSKISLFFFSLNPIFTAPFYTYIK